MHAMDLQPGVPPECRAALQPLRPDVVDADTLRTEPASFAPEWVDGFFVVPAVAALNPERR